MLLTILRRRVFTNNRKFNTFNLKMSKRVSSSGASSSPELEQKKKKTRKAKPSAEKVVIPYDCPKRKVVKDASSYYKVLSWNVDGWRAKLKNSKADIDKLLKDENPDVLFLQETKLQQIHVTEDLLNLFPDFKSIYSCCQVKKGYSGTAVLVNKKKCKEGTYSASFGIGSDAHDGEGRSITLSLPEVNLLGLYVPNSGQKLERLQYRTEEWDKDLREYIKKVSTKTGKPTIVLGDLNVAHRDIDIWNPKAKHIPKTPGCTLVERTNFTNYLKEDEFVDSYRAIHKDTAGAYTYWSTRAGNRPFNRGLRLDYFCVPLSTMEKVEDSFLLHTFNASDHCPVGLLLKK